MIPRSRLALVVAALAATSACTATDSGPRPTEPSRPRLAGDGQDFEFEVRKNIVFQKHDGLPALRLDLYVPDCPGPHPVVVVVPGGAWRFGNRRHPDVMTFSRALVREGVAAAAISYRRAPQHPHPAQIEDCRAAVQYLRAHAEELGIDPTRLAAIGASAGGHLASLLATQDDQARASAATAVARASTKPCCVVSLCAPMDLAWRQDEQPTGLQLRLVSDLFGLDVEDVRRAGVAGYVGELTTRARNASPQTFVDAEDPPFLIVHGTRDEIVPVGQGRRMHRALQQAGVPSTYVEERDSGHVGFFVQINPAEWNSDSAPVFWKAARRFLRLHLLGIAD